MYLQELMDIMPYCTSVSFYNLLDTEQPQQLPENNKLKLVSPIGYRWVGPSTHTCY